MSNATIVIGISGKAEHGKTAAARIIKEAAEAIGLSVFILEISKMILEHCQEQGMIPKGLTREQCTNEQVRILVFEGSRMRNQVDKNYWTNKCNEWIKAHPEYNVVIIPNVRFPQEAGAIRDFGGTVLRLNRLNVDGSPFISMTRDPNHETETALDHWPADFYITNITGKDKLLEAFIRAFFAYVLEDFIGNHGQIVNA